MFGDFIDFDDDEDQEHGHAHGHQQGQGQEEERSRQQQQQRYYIGDQLAIGAFGIVPFSPTIDVATPRGRLDSATRRENDLIEGIVIASRATSPIENGGGGSGSSSAGGARSAFQFKSLFVEGDGTFAPTTPTTPTTTTTTDLTPSSPHARSRATAAAAADSHSTHPSTGPPHAPPNSTAQTSPRTSPPSWRERIGEFVDTLFEPGGDMYTSYQPTTPGKVRRPRAKNIKAVKIKQFKLNKNIGGGGSGGRRSGAQHDEGEFTVGSNDEDFDMMMAMSGMGGGGGYAWKTQIGTHEERASKVDTRRMQLHEQMRRDSDSNGDLDADLMVEWIALIKYRGKLCADTVNASQDDENAAAAAAATAAAVSRGVDAAALPVKRPPVDLALLPVPLAASSDGGISSVKARQQVVVRALGSAPWTIQLECANTNRDVVVDGAAAAAAGSARRGIHEDEEDTDRTTSSSAAVSSLQSPWARYGLQLDGPAVCLDGVKSGAYVAAILPGSAADEGDIHLGDIIVQVDGRYTLEESLDATTERTTMAVPDSSSSASVTLTLLDGDAAGSSSSSGAGHANGKVAIPFFDADADAYGASEPFAALFVSIPVAHPGEVVQDLELYRGIGYHSHTASHARRVGHADAADTPAVSASASSRATVEPSVTVWAEADAWFASMSRIRRARDT